MSDLIGRTLGHYRIVEKIGEGGMGEVYRANDERLDRDVAIKVLHEAVAQDADRLARFEREAKAVAKLDHPNILAIHDFGTKEGVTYSVTSRPTGRATALRRFLSLMSAAADCAGCARGGCCGVRDWGPRALCRAKAQNRRRLPIQAAVGRVRVRLRTRDDLRMPC